MSEEKEMVKTNKIISLFCHCLCFSALSALREYRHMLLKILRAFRFQHQLTHMTAKRKTESSCQRQKGKKISTKYYTVKYPSGRKNVGSYTVRVKFKGKYKGSKSLKFKIVPKGTSVSSVSAGVKSFTVKYKSNPHKQAVIRFNMPKTVRLKMLPQKLSVKIPQPLTV